MNKIPVDKLLHFLVGIAIAAILYPFGYQVALIVVIVAALGKELWDDYGKKGTPEVMDFLVTVLGGLLLVAWYTVIGY
jgi:hypothetical protein